MAERTIVITGATGNQGGAVARELVGKGFHLKALTRKPDSDPAKALAGLGIEIVQGDLDDTASLEKAFTGAWGVFAVQNTWEAGVEKEEEQGKRVAKVAREKGVQHFVYTSVGSAHRSTGIPHFDNKWRVEETIRGLGFPSYAILRPVFFMENLTSPWFLNEDKLMAALGPDTTLQMAAVADIGRVGARLFTHAGDYSGKAVDLAGDALTIPEAARKMGEAAGRKIAYVQLPIEEVRKNSEDFALMLEWCEKVGYNADIPALEREFGGLTKFAEWAGRAVTV